MKEEQQSITFSLFKILTEEFAIIDGAFRPGTQSKVITGITFSFVEQEKLIGVSGKFSFEHSEQPFLVASVALFFKIADADWSKMFSPEDTQLTLNKIPAIHLATLLVGTARGVIHTKTEGRPVNAVILPPINLNEMIKDNLIMRKEQI